MGRMATRRTPSATGRQQSDSGRGGGGGGISDERKTTNRGRTTLAELMRRISPKASRKKVTKAGASSGSSSSSSNKAGFRMSNFASSRKKNSQQLPSKSKTKENGKSSSTPKSSSGNKKKEPTTSSSSSSPELVVKRKPATQQVTTPPTSSTSNALVVKSSGQVALTTTSPSRPLVSSTTTSVFALISTSTTSSSDSSNAGSSSQQLSIAMYHERQENNGSSQSSIQQHSSTSTTTSKSTAVGKVNEDLKHIVDSIERVASGQWMMDSLVVSDKIKGSAGALESSGKKKSETSTDRSIHLRNRSVSLESLPPPPKQPKTEPPSSSSSRGRTVKRRRLACLNAMAKVHCLYDNDTRPVNVHNNRKSRNTTQDSSDEESSSDSSSSSSEEESSDDQSPQRSTGESHRKAIKGSTAGKNGSQPVKKTKSPVKKKKKSPPPPPPSKKKAAASKKRQSMEVPTVNLAQLVTPKRMASLNATAILAASSQQWSTSPRRGGKNNQRVSSDSSDTSSDEDDSGRSSRAEPAAAPPAPPVKNSGAVSKPSSPPILTKKKLAAKKAAAEAAAAAAAAVVASATRSSSVRVSSSSTFHRIEHQTTTGNRSTSTYHAVSSSTGGDGNTSSSKTIHRVSIRTSSSDPVADHSSNNQQQSVGAAGDSYSPLGALYNMRPPHQQQQQQQPEQQEVILLQTSESSGSPSVVKQQQDRLAEKQTLWPSGLAGPALQPPAVNFGGVPLVLSNPAIHHPSAESYAAAAAAAARLTPAFSLYRPDIPYTSFYSPPPHPYGGHHQHFAATPPYYRGFALLPPPGSGYGYSNPQSPPKSSFVPVALADSVYSAYALAPPPPLAVAGPPGTDHLSYFYLQRYHPQPPLVGPGAAHNQPPGLREPSRTSEVVNASSSAGGSNMHGDRNPLPLAASEAAAVSNAVIATSSNARDQSTATKVERGSHHHQPTAAGGASAGAPLHLSHPAHSLLNPASYCPFPAGASSAYGNRCLSTNCSCSNNIGHPSTPQPCPKNAQAGLLTGEGKRSGPNPSASQPTAVIPHPSCRKTASTSTTAMTSNSSKSTNATTTAPLSHHHHSRRGGVASSEAGAPVLPSQIPQASLFHHHGSDGVGSGRPLVPAASSAGSPAVPASITSSIKDQDVSKAAQQIQPRHCETGEELRSLQQPNIRKRKSDVLSQNGNPASPVSSRLRSRNSNSSSNSSSGSGCGLSDCSRTTCCCDCVHLTSNNSNGNGMDGKDVVEHSIPSSDVRPGSIVVIADDSNGNHHYAMDHELEKRQQFGSDILMALADKISGRKGRKKQLLHPSDLSFLDQFNTSLTAVDHCSVTPRPTEDSEGKKFGSNQQQVGPSDENRKKLPVKKMGNNKSLIKAKENAKLYSVPERVIGIQRPRSANSECKLSVSVMPKAESKRGSKSRSPVQPPSSSPLLRWSNGWAWEGASYQSTVHLRNDDVAATRKCYPAMRHAQGDVVRVRDCILLKSGPKAKDLPYVAKVSALWENAEDGEMMMSLLWYYRPEHTDGGRRPTDLADEVFASRHRDVCSVACIEDKCYVLTFNEYCRYRKQAKMREHGLAYPPSALVPLPDESSDYPRRLRLPPISSAVAPDRIFLCRKVYDFRQKRILKNPS